MAFSFSDSVSSSVFNFPRTLDKVIIDGGAWAQRIKDGAPWFEAQGVINGTRGVCQIGINNNGIIFHRTFIPYK